MDGNTRRSGLAAWGDPDCDLFTGVQRVSDHSQFPAACQALAAGMLSIAARDRAMDAIFKDAGRYFAAMWCLSLHEDGGLTLPRLKAVCAESGLLGPGRTRALIKFLEHFHYLERQPASRGAAQYVPTAAFRAAWDGQFIAALEAARCIEPGVGRLLDPRDPVLRQAFGRVHAEGLLQAMHATPIALPILSVFLHHYAGSHVLWTLVASSAEGVFPPVQAGPVSVSGLARACGTSRAQVSRIFHDAAEAGLADLDDDGFVRFHSLGREQLGFLYGVQLAQILAAAAQAEHLPAPPGDG